MRICVCESMKVLSVKERQAAIEAARSIKPEKPSFLVVLQTRNMMEHVVVCSKLLFFLLFVSYHSFKLNLYFLFLFFNAYLVCAGHICSEVLEWR